MNSSTPIIAALFTSMLFNIPLLMVWGGIAVVAVTRWQRHPRVSLLTIIAILIMSIQLIINSSLTVLPVILIDQGISSDQVSAVFIAARVGQICVGSVAWILFGIALFGWRNEDDRNRD